MAHLRVCYVFQKQSPTVKCAIQPKVVLLQKVKPIVIVPANTHNVSSSNPRLLANLSCTSHSTETSSAPKNFALQLSKQTSLAPCTKTPSNAQSNSVVTQSTLTPSVTSESNTDDDPLKYSCVQPSSPVRLDRQTFVDLCDLCPPASISLPAHTNIVAFPLLFDSKTSSSLLQKPPQTSKTLTPTSVVVTSAISQHFTRFRPPEARAIELQELRQSKSCFPL